MKKSKINRCLDCRCKITKNAKRCIGCARKILGVKLSLKFKGENGPNYKDGRSLKKYYYYCVDCGKKLNSHSFWSKSKRCAHCCKVGENNPAYKHGRTLVKSYCSDCDKLLNSQAFLYGHKKCLQCSLLDKNMKQKVFDTDIELKFKDELIKRGISFKHPYRIKSHPVDFYIPRYNLVVECDGYYWHHKPGAEEKDARHNTMMRNKGYFVKRLKGENILKEKINYDKMFERYKQLIGG
jgi:very-short-patch-repair endonuclease